MAFKAPPSRRRHCYLTVTTLPVVSSKINNGCNVTLPQNEPKSAADTSCRHYLGNVCKARNLKVTRMGKALVYGRGVSGTAAANLLSKLGCEVRVFADGEAPTPQLEEFDLVVVSPSVPPGTALLQRARALGISVIGETELGFRHCPSDIVAITGTNGKTTATMMCAHMLNSLGLCAHALGNIGVPLSARVLELSKTDVVVLEISSFQLETIDTFRPKIGVCLNITPDHLDYHGSFEDYAAAKKNLFSNMTERDSAVLNFDDPVVKTFHKNPYYFSLERDVRGVFVKDGIVYFKQFDFSAPKKLFAAKDLKQRGLHNLANALAVTAVGMILGYPPHAVRAAIAGFGQPPHRLEKIGKIAGRTYFNDSKATNADATLKACAAMKGSTALIMGGYDKGLSYRNFFERLPKCVTEIVCFGQNKQKLAADMPKPAKFNCEFAQTLQQAVKAAGSKKVINVLFSPATSSYDMYKNYAARGEAFVEIVRALINEQ